MARRKKGSLQDIIWIIVVIITLTIGTLIAYKVSYEINAKFQESDIITTKGKTASNQITNLYPTVVDNSFLLLVIGLSIVAIALSAMVRVHPVFFIFFLIVLVIIIFISGVFSNLYREIASNPELIDLAKDLVYMTYVMRFLPFIIGVIGFILSFIMYKTWANA